MTVDRPRRIAFLHPTLGVGGAERLVVDAARQLARAGHRVTMFTSHHDGAHSLAGSGDGGVDIRVRGAFIPAQLGQRLRAPLAIARMAYLSAVVARSTERFDVVFCDVVAHAVPLLKLLGRARVVFYCHFPDLLHARRGAALYRAYRAPIDRLEEAGTGMADRVLVNSRFTADVFRQTFPRLRADLPEVVHPGIDCARYDPPPASTAAGADEREIVILSINRYDPQKNLALAIEALARLRERLSPEVFDAVRLVMVGAYEHAWREHRETLRALEDLARERGVASHVVFVRSCPEPERLALLARCRCVVYTPSDEHFGIVPLEAMAARRPVVAVASGGPLETVAHGRTGFLCPPTAEGFADALVRMVLDPGEARRMGEAGRRHVEDSFSLAAFGARLDAIVQELTATPEPSAR